MVSYRGHAGVVRLPLDTGVGVSLADDKMSTVLQNPDTFMFLSFFWEMGPVQMQSITRRVHHWLCCNNGQGKVDEPITNQ
jgi:hypothetical protein